MRIPPGRTVLAACVRLLFMFAGLTTVAARPTAALPPGKAWSAVVDTLKLPGHTYGLAPTRMETDTAGVPLVITEALGGIGQDMYVLRWTDSAWRAVAHLGYGTMGIRPVPSPPGTHHLIWNGLEEIFTPRRMSYLVMSEFVGDSLTRPDTVALVRAGTLKYAAAASPVRRWAAASDGDLGDDLRVFYSDRVGAWTEVPVPGAADRSVAATVLDDTTALFAWRDRDEGPGAAMLRGAEWVEVAPPPIRERLGAVPMFRQRPSGGHWLSWATEDHHVGIASYRDGAWSPPESILCAYRRPERHRSQSRAYMSQDDGEYPAVAWMAVSSRNGLTSVCVCVPSDSGFPVAENLEGSDQGLGAQVARDRNRDVWVTWWAPNGMGWVHTYTKATASAPTILGAGRDRAVTWTLSELAPGTWWAVLRARNEGPFEEVARLRAGPGVEMSWTDDSPPAGILRYRIRRESVDAAYRWESEETRWPPRSQRPLIVMRGAVPVAAHAPIEFAVQGAEPGPLEVRLYDLQGRRVAAQEAVAAGDGWDTVRLELGTAAPGLATGVYFLQVRDAAGRESGAAKVVVLR